MNDMAFLERAVELAVRSVDECGGPFGAVIVRDGTELACGENRVTRDHDPSAHAEVVAIRRAGAALGSHVLTGCVLYASCEPCPMCLSTALWARVDAIWYAADRYAAARSGFDDAAFHDLLRRDRAGWPIPVRQHGSADADAPFRAWAALEERAEY